MEQLLKRIAQLEARITDLEQQIRGPKPKTTIPTTAKTTPDDGSFLHPLRAKCSCGGELGDVHPKGGQYCVYCVDCNKYQYNVPKRISRNDHSKHPR